MKLKFYYFLLAFCILWGCANVKKQNLNKDFVYDISVEKSNQPVAFDDLVRSYRYVQLETDSNSLIGEIKKVLVHQNKVIVVSEGLVCFDDQGKHLYHIRAQGRGPSEFIQLSDVCIDGNKLYVYDNYQYKVMVFNVENGEFLETFALQYSVKNLQMRGDKLIADRGTIPNTFISSTDQLLISSRSNQERLRSFLPNDSSQVLVENRFYGSNGSQYWLNPLRNQVTKILDSLPVPYLKLSFGSLSVGANENKAELTVESLSSQGKAFFLSKFYETEGSMFAKLQLGTNPLMFWMNKNSKRYLCYENIELKHYQVPPMADAVLDNKFYQLIPVLECNFRTYSLLENKLALKPGEEDFENYRVIRDFKEDNNPVLAIYELKAF